MPLLIGNNLVVSMHYKLSDDEGNVIDSSEGGEPLSFLHGAGNIIPGLENALVGKVEGDCLQVMVQPEDGYGEVIPELIQTVDKAAFQGVDDIQPGMAFEAQGPEGTPQRIIVRAVEGDEVTVDGNHPLAGMQLSFDVQVVNVREAQDDEISHGHAH